MKLQPLRDLCVIVPDPRPDTTDAGFFVAKPQWEEAINHGVVGPVGPQVEVIKEGDHVIYNPYAVVEAGSTNFIRECDILSGVEE